MPCLCGDTNCPSCGPAQGYDPHAELVTEWLKGVILKNDTGHNDKDMVNYSIKDLAYFLTMRFIEDAPPEVFYEMARAAREWEKGGYKT